MKQNAVYYLKNEEGKSIYYASLFECMILFFTLLNEGARNIYLSLQA